METVTRDEPAAITLTREQAGGRWTQACQAIELKGRFVRHGNWVPLAHALRHKDCEAATVTVVEQDGSTILKIEPEAVDPKDVPKGKSVGKRPAFYLIVI